MQELFKALSKRGGISVLYAVCKSKYFNKIVELSGYDRGTVYRRLEEFVKLGLILKRYDLESKLLNYIITPTGKRILKLVEEIERVYREGVLAEEIKQSEPDVLESADEEVSKPVETPIKGIIDSIYNKTTEEDMIVEAKMCLKELDIDFEDEVESEKSKRKKRKR
jgi:DNA-binding MarR family transcriptional regulator